MKLPKSSYRWILLAALAALAILAATLAFYRIHSNRIAENGDQPLKDATTMSQKELQARQSVGLNSPAQQNGQAASTTPQLTAVQAERARLHPLLLGKGSGVISPERAAGMQVMFQQIADGCSPVTMWEMSNSGVTTTLNGSQLVIKFTGIKQSYNLIGFAEVKGVGGKVITCSQPGPGWWRNQQFTLQVPPGVKLKPEMVEIWLCSLEPSPRKMYWHLQHWGFSNN